MLSSPHGTGSPPLDGGQSQTERLNSWGRLFAEAPAAWIITSPECVVLDANAEAETLLARRASAMRNKPFRHLVAYADRLNFDIIAADMLKSHIDGSRPLCVKPKNGSDLDVIFKARMLRTPEGVPEMISWVLMEPSSNGLPDLA